SSLISVMMVAVVPKVTSIFSSLDRALPWYTAALILVSDVLSSAQMGGFILTLGTMVSWRKAIQSRSHGPQSKEEALAKKSVSGWVLIALFFTMFLLFAAFAIVESIVAFGEGVALGMVVGFVIARFVAFLGTPPGRLWRDTRLLKLPIFGPLLRMLAVSRFARTLATLLEAGVPLLKALEIVRNVIGNAKLEKTVEEAAASIREGASIAAPLKRSGDFPPIVIHMIAVGEKSGQLESMLQNVAKAYDTQVDTSVQALTSLLEPLMIVFMGGAVGFIAFSIMMPLIQMNDFVQ
ncbi:MAG: type II secretion system F family protein, partial [Polyangiaceae bacterium]